METATANPPALPDTLASAGKDETLEAFRQMLRIRRFEETAARAYTRGKISGFLHLYIGQEAIAIGTKLAMGDKDRVVGYGAFAFTRRA